ncbi:hypothetical protein [Actinorugispora endophytica]|uniref:Uncharacterized protein n=1 Tax=Actinorugispora endophytica TaxID=1605990 RepID=A0A4R6UY59_9ACTN|nr:hypothetical protein [Actinorugispora endophytica]TDQ52440.1 hypothetical protein EV190_10678 [Actinorugispora endophytica]
MNSLLINIAVFGVGGVVLNVALQGLLLVLLGRNPRPGPRVALGAAAALVLVALPALAAVELLADTPNAGFASAFVSALCVALLVFGSNLAVSALTARASRDVADAPRPRLVSTYLGGLAACLLIGLLASALALLAT